MAKPDALSRIFPTTKLTSEPEPVLPPIHFMAAISYESEKQVSRLLSKEAPHNLLYVLPELSSQVIHWGHSSDLSFHPGTISCPFCSAQKTSH